MKKILFLALFGLTLFSRIFTSQPNIPFEPLTLTQAYDDESLAEIPSIDQSAYKALFTEFINIQFSLRKHKVSLPDGLDQLQKLMKLSHDYLADKESQTKFATPLKRVMGYYQKQLAG